jgi:cardiolipin synthase
MKSAWFAVCLVLLLGSPVALRAQSPPSLTPGGGGLARAAIAEPSDTSQATSVNDSDSSPAALGLGLGALTVLPDDGRGLYFSAIDGAKREILIEICVLEDPEILQHIQAALQRGVQLRAIVDRGKYDAPGSLEPGNLAQYLTSAGGQLHLSNPVFPRSFPKIILVDSRLLIFGSACLDETTFAQYRDFATASTNPKILRQLLRLFENDWTYSAAVAEEPPPFNPTPRIAAGALAISPVNSAERLVRLYQRAKRTLDVYTELLGNANLEGELVAAADRGVRVRLIAPQIVNDGTTDIQQLQFDSLTALSKAGVDVHVSGPDESAQMPYMHARAAVVDNKIAYLGSISLSPDSTTFNREMGLISRQRGLVRKLEAQFESDFSSRTMKF